MLMNANSLPGGWLESGHGSISIYIKDYRDPLERKKKLILRPWASIKDIKDQLQVLFNIPSHVQILYYQGRELQNIHNLVQCGIYQDNAIIDFVARRTHHLGMLYQPSSPPTSPTASPTASSVLPIPIADIHPYGTHLLPITLMKVMHQALQGLALGLAPVLAMDGTGGTYFLKDPSHRIVGCFKPQDEEPFSPNNPREFIGTLGQSGLRRGILSGEACEREVAAYLFDHNHFANVPATSLVQARHPIFHYSSLTTENPFKIGSLQEFIRHDDVASDLAPSLFSTHQVHKIVLLDMRLLNTDRNDANILVRKRRILNSNATEYELIPIDHGYCLPHVLEIAWCDWCWYHWPQLHEPLSESDRKYILALDPVEQVNQLTQKIPLRSPCRRNLLIANMLVYKGVMANLVLYEIAKMMCREELDCWSLLERMCLEAFHQSQAQTPKKRTSSSSTTTNRRRLSLSIDTNDRSNTYSAYSPRTLNGARSPPGFWASYTPFTEENDDDDEEEGTCEWNTIASRALNDAASTLSKETDHSTFGLNENHDQDEFELLNEALDTNLQQEKLFLTILGRLMDEKIQKIP